VSHVAELTRTIQSFDERLPTPELAGHVACIWTQQVPRDASPYPHRTTPNGSAMLVCQVGSAPQLVGPQTGPTEQDLTPGTVVVGIRLRPGAASALFRVSALDLIDRTVCLDDVWPDARVLGEKVAEAALPQAAAAMLEAELRTRIPADALLDTVATQAVHRLAWDPTTDVATLAAALGISQRQLRRRCETAIGYPPKVLQRIIRFQRFLALARAQNQAQPHLGLLAAQTGFADQAHLTREFQRLAGRSPGTALREAAEHCDGNHDHSASDAAFLMPARARVEAW
jgi:AraC-like DNA-binding protein